MATTMGAAGVPFDLPGGVTVLARDRIRYQGREYVAAVGEYPGVTYDDCNWLTGERAERRLPDQPNVWERPGERMGPSVGPVWYPDAYVPTPAFVRAQFDRRARGESLLPGYWNDDGNVDRLWNDLGERW